jgi:hypothetical protein
MSISPLVKKEKEKKTSWDMNKRKIHLFQLLIEK